MTSKIYSTVNRLFQTSKILLLASILAMVIPMIGGAGSNAHELWIEPQTSAIEVGDQVITDIIVGQDFTGNAQIYLPSRTEMLAIANKDGITDLTPRPGSRPAISFDAEKQGHLMVFYQSADEYVNYQYFDKFAGFVTEKHAPDILALHRKRGLPEKDFKERYKRFAKSSMFIGRPTTALVDNDTDMELEFILLDISPADNGHEQARIRLTYQNRPVPEAPLSLFIKPADGAVTKHTLYTDEHGEASIPTVSGNKYLLDYVVIRTLDPDSDPVSAIWESLWASLSFSTHAQP